MCDSYGWNTLFITAPPRSKSAALAKHSSVLVALSLFWMLHAPTHGLVFSKLHNDSKVSRNLSERLIYTCMPMLNGTQKKCYLEGEITFCLEQKNLNVHCNVQKCTMSYYLLLDHKRIVEVNLQEGFLIFMVSIETAGGDKITGLIMLIV